MKPMPFFSPGNPLVPAPERKFKPRPGTPVQVSVNKRRRAIRAIARENRVTPRRIGRIVRGNPAGHVASVVREVS